MVVSLVFHSFVGRALCFHVTTCASVRAKAIDVDRFRNPEQIQSVSRNVSATQEHIKEDKIMTISDLLNDKPRRVCPL